MKKKLLAGICLLMISIVAHATTIHFATEATYPPFEYVDAKGELQGFDIDLARAVCHRLNAECQFSKQSFNSLIPGLNLRKFDAIIASIGVTAARQKQVSFTQSYYTPSAAFVALKKKNYSPTSIINKNVGVQAGSTFEQYLRTKYANTLSIKTYASIQEAFLDLRAGRIDLVLADTPIAKAWLNENNNQSDYSIVDKPITDEAYFGAGYAIAVNKNNLQLLNDFNQALDALKADGTYGKLIHQYFGT